jgi:hypothetical protein
MLDIPTDQRAAHGNTVEATTDYSPGGGDRGRPVKSAGENRNTKEGGEVMKKIL